MSGSANAVAVTLVLRAVPSGRLDLRGVTPDRLERLTSREIAALPVLAGRQAAAVGDFFDVGGERSARLRIEGATGALDGIGAGMTGGELTVEGDAGNRLAAGMRGGAVIVNGNAGDDAGQGMRAGRLRIAGHAGDRLGAASPGASRGMSGGEILVRGNTGRETGARCRRGLIVVGGDTGAHAARSMIAGTLIVLGRCGAEPGRGSKRGSVVAIGGIAVPSTYRYACTFEAAYVRLVLRYLQAHHGVPIPSGAMTGFYRRYCGDLGLPGKGEILELARP